MMKTLGRITGMLALALLTTHVGRAQEPALANIRSASMMVIAPRVEANAPQAQTKLVSIAMATSVICHKSGQQAMLEDVNCQNRPKRKSTVCWHATRRPTRSRLLPASSQPNPSAFDT